MLYNVKIGDYNILNTYISVNFVLCALNIFLINFMPVLSSVYMSKYALKISK